MEGNNTRYILSENIKAEENNRKLSNDVAIEIIRSIKEIIFKLIEYKYQSAICHNKNI